MILQEIMNFLKTIRKMVLKKNRCKEPNKKLWIDKYD